MWKRVFNINEVPIGSYISSPHKDGDSFVPNEYWYKEDLSVFSIFRGIYPHGFKYSSEVLEECSWSYSSQRGFINDFPLGILYKIEVEPYDPNQEPEDDCI